MRQRTRKSPLISANFAITWDGRISTRRHTPSDFSSPEDKRRFLALRARADAVLVTIGTAEADGMSIGLSSPGWCAERQARGQTASPTRVLVTNSGRIPLDLPVFSQPGAPIVIYSARAPSSRVRGKVEKMADLRIAHTSRLDMRAVAAELRDRDGIRHLHCEGGGRLLGTLAAEELLDELYLTLCPRVFGSEAAPTLTGVLDNFLPRSSEFRFQEMEQVGEECFLKLKFLRRRTSPGQVKSPPDAPA